MIIITGKGPGLYGNGMDQFIRDDLELGERVALSLDHEQCWGAVLTLAFMEYGL